MAKFTLIKGKTDFSAYAYAQSSGAAVGITGLTSASTGLSCYYARARSSAVSIPLITLGAITSAHSDGGIVQVDGTNMPGLYRVDLPDAVFATGADGAVVVLHGYASLAPIVFEFHLSDFDLNDATPNVTVSDIANNAITAAAIAQDAIDADAIKTDAITEIQAGLATPTNITAGTITNATNVTNGVTLADDAITSAKFDESTAFPVKKADSTTTELARLDSAASYKATGFATPTNITAASGVTLAATQTGVTIPTVTTVTNAPTGMALEATLTAIKGGTWTNQTLVKIVSDIAAISAGSGASVADILNALLASYTVSGSVGESLGRLDNIQAKTDLITTGTTITLASPVSGSTITAQRGDSLSAALENIGALTNHSKIYFTVKADASDADAISLIQIEHTAGLTYINGAAAVTAANGTLTVDDEATGDVTIGLAAVEVAKLSPGQYSYDIQIVRSAGVPVSTLTSGTFIVASDITRAVT